ncbi:methionine adenosyltransferase domain-containing protein [Candidatus Saccharibacteria bacterium TM7i]|nr:methionine adenosyltransferase domain-containing protein [Candidatus Saccharibacteria bacterium TM7i]
MPTFKTAESVSPKHPDKICDQISDAILDAHLKEDSEARVAVDVAGGHGAVFITGEVTSRATKVDIARIVQRLAGDVEIIERITKQSPEIAQGVDTGGAGDQGIMVGYATSETPEFLPLEVVLAQKLNKYLYERWPFDGKTQVTTCDGKIHTIVASFQHAPTEALEVAVKTWQRTQSIAPSYAREIIYHINPAGDWDIGGFDADAGLTGRKLAVDNYGPTIPVGGGAFSGKDPSKVDRSAAYMARKIAIDYVRRFQANEVYVTLAYAIGYSQPVQAVAVVDGREVQVEGYDLSPLGIVEFLNLKMPQYEQTARYGHFADSTFTWNR